MLGFPLLLPWQPSADRLFPCSVLEARKRFYYRRWSPISISPLEVVYASVVDYPHLHIPTLFLVLPGLFPNFLSHKSLSIQSLGNAGLCFSTSHAGPVEAILFSRKPLYSSPQSLRNLVVSLLPVWYNSKPQTDIVGRVYSLFQRRLAIAHTATARIAVLDQQHTCNRSNLKKQATTPLISHKQTTHAQRRPLSTASFSFSVYFTTSPYLCKERFLSTTTHLAGPSDCDQALVVSTWI